jgi:hypothetical protein
MGNRQDKWYSGYRVWNYRVAMYGNGTIQNQFFKIRIETRKDGQEPDISKMCIIN